MATILEHPSTITPSEPDTQFVIPAATVWSNSSHFTSKEEEPTSKDQVLLCQALRTKQASKTTINIPLNQESRPRVGPNKRRCGSKVQPPGDVDSPKRARYLERSRVAANKCRLRKKHEQDKMQHALNEATAKRNTLLAEVNKLKEEVWQLKNSVFAHAECGDHRIDLQLSKMTQKLLESSSSQCPSSSVSEISSSDGWTGKGKRTNLSTASPVSLAVDDTVTYPEDTFDVFDCYIDLPTCTI